MKCLKYEPERSRKIDTFPRKITKKSNQDKDKSFYVQQLWNTIRALTNEVVGLNKNSQASTYKVFFRNQFRKNTTNNNKNSPPGVVINEEIFNTIRVVLSIPESSSKQIVFYQEE